MKSTRMFFARVVVAMAVFSVIGFATAAQVNHSDGYVDLRQSNSQTRQFDLMSHGNDSMLSIIFQINGKTYRLLAHKAGLDADMSKVFGNKEVGLYEPIREWIIEKEKHPVKIWQKPGFWEKLEKEESRAYTEYF